MASADVYLFNGTEYPIEIIRINNKNTYIRVKDNKVIVTTNYLVSNRNLLIKILLNIVKRGKIIHLNYLVILMILYMVLMIQK